MSFFHDLIGRTQEVMGRIDDAIDHIPHALERIPEALKRADATIDGAPTSHILTHVLTRLCQALLILIVCPTNVSL